MVRDIAWKLNLAEQVLRHDNLMENIELSESFCAIDVHTGKFGVRIRSMTKGQKERFPTFHGDIDHITEYSAFFIFAIYRAALVSIALAVKLHTAINPVSLLLPQIYSKERCSRVISQVEQITFPVSYEIM